MAEYLIVDGYNVINAWKEFTKLRVESLEHAREI
ncbi:MAG: NYN domain-containing protein, partial [Phascolarctobacterium sp.]|nr:NYN domain-containing protein [Phascolarctobacterium sp.]